MSYPPAYPHDPIEEIGPDVFLVRGSIPLNRLMRITRNMVIVRHAGELTLVDPIRLSDTEEARLRTLGTVKHLLRLGPMHGLDDPYWKDTTGAELWTPGPSEAYPEPKADHVVEPGGPLPIPEATLFRFEETVQAEAMLLLHKGPGLLVTCDAIQHYGDYRHNNLPARIMMPFIGFPKTTIVGPVWLKIMTREGQSLEGEFRRLLELDFDALIAAHGSFLPTGAHAGVRRAVDKAFAK
ncbi:MAG: hypothetical protein AAF430_20920 [Myxococcota bacterium]